MGSERGEWGEWKELCCRFGCFLWPPLDCQPCEGRDLFCPLALLPAPARAPALPGLAWVIPVCPQALSLLCFCVRPASSEILMSWLLVCTPIPGIGPVFYLSEGHCIFPISSFPIGPQCHLRELSKLCLVSQSPLSFFQTPWAGWRAFIFTAKFNPDQWIVGYR